MSEENVEAVRQPIAVRAQSRPSPEERLFSHFPRVSEPLARAVGRFWRLLPPGSRLRWAITRRYVRLVLEAANRGDPEAAFGLGYERDVELIVPPQLVGLGFERLARGRDERIRFQRKWTAEWGAFTFDPKEIIDFGDGRVLLVGHTRASGLSSGAAVDSFWANLLWVPAGRVVREQPFFDRGEALEAAGLKE